jgi:hypothetical protein
MASGERVALCRSPLAFIPAASPKQRLCRHSPFAILFYICPNHNPMRLILTAVAMFLSAMLFAQAPALIPYQAIARNAAGEPLASKRLALIALVTLR